MVSKKAVSTVAPATTPNTPKPVLFGYGPKVANHKVAHNQAMWANIVTLLAANPNGVTKAQLQGVCGYNMGFARYCIKSQWLALVA